MVTPELKAHYDAVARDLETRKITHRAAIEEHKRALEEIDQTIAGIKRLTTEMNGSRDSVHVLAGGRRFATMSMRWAILHVLGETQGAMASSDIADALRAGGANSNAVSFNSNVSAVLSKMKSGKGEVSLTESGKWEMTDIGRSVLARIKANRTEGATSPLSGL